ncbi:MAG: response regulator [Proteiniphilum sp.]|uniref:response regulator n=1 Tax=Proteiniphilum sp. TaxID=1926877 RepID=UPI002B21775D|nr:response regulator [Proteiniphilum sp.]MEA5127462.1 response regulator [Proteiniphilum sp.]
MKYLFLILLFFVFYANIYSQQIIARQVSFFYQLPSNEIWDFYQDKEGYLWIGTTSGLVRYDGHRLQFFRSNHQFPDLLTNNSIVCMSDNDSYVWIGTRKGLNLFEKETCRIFPVPENKLQNKDITGISIDKNDICWVAAEGSIYKCDKDGNLLKEYPLTDFNINHVYNDNEGNLWVLAWNTGIFKYDSFTDSFFKFPKIGEQNNPFTILQDNSDNYWIGTWGDGLWQFFPEKTGSACYKKYHVFNPKSGQSDPIIFSLAKDDTYDYLWALSFNELYALMINEKGIVENINIHDLLDPYMMFTRIFKDRNGNLWLSSYDMAYTIYFDNSKIKNYPLPQIKERLGWDANIVNLCMDSDGIMWVNQDRYGLSVYDLYQNKLSGNEINNYENTLQTRVIVKSDFKKGVWIGSGGTPSVMRLVQRDLNMYVEENIDLQKLTNNAGEIKQLIEDGKGNLWMLTSTCLFLRPVGENSIIVVDKSLPPLLILSKDMQGEIWGIGVDHTLYHLNTTGNSIISERNSPISILQENEEIRNVCMDKNECLWIISSLGKVYKSDKDKRMYNNIPLEKELEESSALDLRSDRENVWIVTNKKVIQYDVIHNTTYNYSTSDGNIFVNVFRSKAVTQDEDGGLYVGGHGGFTYISSTSESVHRSDKIHPTVTDLRVNNQSVFFSLSHERDIHSNTINKIYLDANDRNIEIFCSTLEYPLNTPRRIAYKMEGVDRDWVYLDYDKSSAFYNQLKKGTYKFWLKTEDEHGKWTVGEMLLIIEKFPAVYETWYAYFIYVLFFSLSVYLILRQYLKRIKRKHNTQLREELNRTKLDYFTNVSHEILTPLTVISSTVDIIEMKDKMKDKQVVVLKSNIDKLKRLIQQILDFRKMDMGKMRLNVSYGNIADFVTHLCYTGFTPLTLKKNIVLQTNIEPQNLCGYLDFDKLDKILYNLLSNAVKYTPENKQIGVTIRQILRSGHTYVQIKIADEGVGIAHKELDKIFTRFYNNRKSVEVESNGIGLSLTKDIVNLHHGSIMVESTIGKGSCFTVELPIDKDSYNASELIEDAMPSEEFVSGSPVFYSDTDKLTLLFVDDNADLLYTMKEMFKERYNIVTATCGTQAWEKLKDYEVDLVISDVMMPDENGWDFCKRIKSDLRFSHIPVIILTAKNNMDDRVSSYEAGADGYVAKPFELKVLSARVENLIKSYRIRQDAFQKEQNTSLESIAYQSTDKNFLEGIIESILQHLDESEFDLEKLASDMNISKSTLYRKIKSITGLTPLDFIRNIKMKHACMMLKSKGQTISQIAYALGFNNPKYFSKCFKEEFGISPTEYQQNS